MEKQSARGSECCEKSTAGGVYGDWAAIPWAKLERQVFKMQKRIYRARREGNVRKVKRLQRILLDSKANLLVSIRKITTRNRGRKTAGIDGVVALTDKERIGLYRGMLKEGWRGHRPSPAITKSIPKRSGKRRILKILPIKDRVWQNVLLNALAPEWEAVFEPTSYAFRNKRNTADAIERIAKACRGGKKVWIFEGDFEGCFDNLDQKFILERIKEFPGAGLIEKWLKAGVMDGGALEPTEKGAAQGSVISPLLCNIALHGMDEALGVEYKHRDQHRADKYGLPVISHTIVGDYTVVRFADDFVVITDTEEKAGAVFGLLEPYLEKRGLRLQMEKTKVTNLRNGFDFLGFNIRLRESRQSCCSPRSKLIIKPSKEAVKSAKAKVKEVFDSCRGLSVGLLIQKLNPVVRGIGQYWSKVSSKETFAEMDQYIWTKTRRFLRRLHPHKPWKWIVPRYFKPDIRGVSKNKWILTDPNDPASQLMKMSWIPIKYHTMVRYDYSPFDCRCGEYFKERDRKEFDLRNPLHKGRLAKRQNYTCPLCGLPLAEFDRNVDSHHKMPKCKGGPDTMDNLQLVHKFCHNEYHKWFPAEKGEPTKESYETFIEFYRERLWGKGSA